jgi:hypothetical protein
MDCSRYALSRAAPSLCWLTCAGLLASACGDDDKRGGARPDAGTEQVDGGRTDAGGHDAEAAHDDAEEARDDAAAEELDGSSESTDAESESGADTGDMVDAGCGADAACSAGDRLAPFRLDCANLPSDGACQGGPREVLLVMARSGHVLMFDASDGHFLGYFKREPAQHNTQGISGFFFATQGPDQCIWSVSEASGAGVQRWNPDGTFKDAPLEAKFLPVSGAPDQPAIQNPQAIAFSRDRLFVASHYGTPHPRVTRWRLDGKFDAIALEDELEIRSLLALGDGSLLLADSLQDRVVRIPAGGGPAEPVLGGLSWPAQVSYTAGGKALIADDSSGEAVYEVAIETGEAKTVYPYMGPSGVKGIAALKNGKWLIAGGEYVVSVLDPMSSNPTGQYQVVWNDKAVAPDDFFHVGRACLSEAFVASRGSKPADDVCVDAPAGTAIFQEDFESGTFEGSGTSRHYNSFHDLGVAGVTTSIDPTGGPDGSRALKIAGAGHIDTGDPDFPQRHKTGMSASFAGGQPKYISYRVKVASPEQLLGYLLLENAAADAEEFQWLAGTSFEDGVLSVLESNAETSNDLTNQWVRVELRNIDWTTRTYDLYIDCVRLAEGIGLPAGLGDSIDRIDVYNYPYATDANTIAWYDDILIK